MSEFDLEFDPMQVGRAKNSTGVELADFLRRIENLEEDKKAVADDIKEVYGEAKGRGYDTKVLRKIVAMRKIDKQKREEQEAIMETYLHALGMI